MEAINTFEGGLNQDIAKSLQRKNTYFEAFNFRIVTEDGQSTGILSNSDGNSFVLTFPHISAFLKYTFFTIPVVPTSYIFTDNLNGLTYTFNYTGSGNIYDQLANFLNDNTNFPDLGISAHSYSTYVGLYSTNHSDIMSLISVPLGIGVSTIVDNVGDLVPIGSTNIRDEIFILTTSKLNIIPHQNPNIPNASQIWKLTYDSSLVDQTPFSPSIFNLELLYHNYLDFSLTYPVAPTAIVGNYENSTIKKIYWCDFYNVRRSFNTADPEGYFLDPSLLSSQPTVTFDIPYLTGISENSGNQDAGMYQFAYRYKTVGGVKTAFSLASELISIVGPSESGSDILTYKSFFTPSTGIAKTLNLRIDNVDSDFDRIEIIYLAWKNANNISSVPDEIAIFLDEPVPKTGSFNFNFSGTEKIEVISAAEYIGVDFSPLINKTMAIKDNVLLISNVKSQKLDLNFDCRAYRYQLNSNNTYPHGTNPDDSDDVNPNQSPTSWNNYLYQQNSNILGGTGPNISYKFVIEDTILDTHPIPTYAPIPYWDPGKNTIPIISKNGKVYNNINFYKNSSNPAQIGTLRGYQRNEIYRFGVVFFDLSGKPSWVKWIADIRIPDIYMPDTSSVNPTDRTLQYQLTDYNGSDTVKGRELGIEFTINNLNTISSQVSGWSIVRVQRTQQDKTIIAHGFTCVAHYQTSGVSAGTHYSCYGSSTGGSYNDNPTSLSVDFSDQMAMFCSPETLFSQPSINRNDILEITGVLDDIQESQMYGSSHSTISDTSVQKCAAYDNPVSPITPGSASAITKEFSIVSATYADNYKNQTTFTVNGIGFQNNSENEYSQANRGLALNLDPTDFKYVANTAPKWFVGDNIFSTDQLYAARIKRNLTNQYGGNTASQKSFNNYISCGHYQAIDSTTVTLTSKVYGGDVWVNLMDYIRDFKAWDIGTSTKYAWAFIYPTESYINVPMREGEYVLNRDEVPDTGTGIDTQEDFIYYDLFNNEEILRIFVPKQIPFITTDEYDNRTYASNVKINGELIDSWNIFDQVDYKDVDGVYGPINAIIAHNNQIHFFQDRAFGIIPVFPRVIQSNAGTADSQLQLGIGPKLDKHQYISNNTGTKHQWSLTPSDNSLYWYDVLSKKVYKYSGGTSKLSDIKGMHTYFDKHVKGTIMNNDNPILKKGICSIYDYKNNEILFTFHDEITNGGILINSNFTLAYNELADCFTSFYNFSPNLYITNRQVYLSNDIDNPTDIYLHLRGNKATYYGRTYPSTIKIITNENPKITKVFDNQVIMSESIDNSSGTDININDDVFNTLRVYNDYQNTAFQTFVLDVSITRKERSWQYAIPRNRVLYTLNNSPDIFTNLSFGNKKFGERIRDKYIYTDLRYNNLNNYKFLFHNLSTLYRISPR